MDFSTAIGNGTVPGTNLPLIEPIWSFWLDVARLALMTTEFAARQIKTSVRASSRGIPRVELPPAVIELLIAWHSDHGDGKRASARAANYVAHYGLRLPSGKGGVKPSRFLDAFHALLIDAFH